MKLKDYLNETTVSSDISTFDKKIGDDSTTSQQFNTKEDISYIIKDLKKRLDITVSYNPVIKDGIVSGPESTIFIKSIKGM